MNYVRQFLSLRCAGDVLNVVGNVNKPDKEISEAMAMMKYLKEISLKPDHKMKSVLVDLCAGNALTSVIAAHLLPFQKVIAVDREKRTRDWDMCKRFEYRVCDINRLRIHNGANVPTPDEEDVSKYSVILSVHCCKDTATRVIDLFLTSGCRYALLMPCCVDKQAVQEVPQIIRKKLGTYLAWCVLLRNRLREAGYKVKMTRDKGILSPCNVIIFADSGY